jgi:hypothetical protein
MSSGAPKGRHEIARGVNPWTQEGYPRSPVRAALRVAQDQLSKTPLQIFAISAVITLYKVVAQKVLVKDIDVSAHDYRRTR